jgi:hypothetical protein
LGKEGLRQEDVLRPGIQDKPSQHHETLKKNTFINILIFSSKPKTVM